MAKLVALLVKKPGMSADEFRSYWKERHSPVAAKMPGLKKYIQNHSPVDMAGGTPAVDGVAELWFDSPQAIEAAFASPEGQAALADVPNFLDPQATKMMIVEESSAM